MPKSIVFIKRTSSTSKTGNKKNETIKNIEELAGHLKYIGFRSQELSEEQHKGFFGRDNDHVNYKAFIARVKNNKALKHPRCVKAHKLVFSLRQTDYEAYKRSGKDYKHLIRATLKKYEDKYNVKLDWVASIHDVKGHPHCHVVIKGVSDIEQERGFPRIWFKIPDDFKDMKFDFENEFMKDVKYKFFEREDVKDITKDASKGFEAVLNAIKQEIKKDQAKGEYEKNKGLFSQIRNSVSNEEFQTKESLLKENKSKNIDR